MTSLPLRALNRTFLQRQHLLRPADMTPMAMTAHLLGLQAQVNNPPYIGLWTRLQTFERDALTEALRARQIVRAAAWRSTLHLMTAADYLALRRAFEPALIKGLNAFFGTRARALDVPLVVDVARQIYEDAPRTQAEIRTILLESFPDNDPDALAYCARSYLSLVQVFPGGTWSKGGSPAYAAAESHLSASANPDYAIMPVFRRYLAACGPASIMDFQTWTGMTRLKGVIESHQGEFRLYTDANGVALYDLPEMAIVEADTPAPIRFIPEYDNVLLSHSDRNRILADADYRKVFLSAARVLATVLVDGFVAAAWRVDRDKKRLILTIAPFAALTAEVTTQIEAEALKVLAFVADMKDDPAGFAVRWA
ncbi:MAG: winged helix DNA-binding domain-containing protein [Chloroflexota bacterium]|nr:winged helix DNA-binding domain-containing protein [Chloroflexota bacterium]